jgi:hypothetical protein
LAKNLNKDNHNDEELLASSYVDGCCEIDFSDSYTFDALGSCIVFFLEHAGELRIIVFIGGEKSLI